MPDPKPLHDRFVSDLLANRHNRSLLARWDELALPDGWLVAGCLFQTVWNLRADRAPESDIKDYDLFYFDPDDLSREAELRVQARVEAVVGDLGITVEAANQARVHLWYEADYGEPYPALHSSRDGIQRFLVPSTCVGVRPAAAAVEASLASPLGSSLESSFEVYAPNGLAALYDGVLAMNPLVPHRQLFERKVASYQRRWPWLRIEG